MQLPGYITIVKMIVAVLPFLAMAFRSSRINLERKDRGHQFLMPIIAFAYCIPAMLAVDKIAIAMIHLTSFVSRIVGFIPVIGDILQRFFGNLYSTFEMGLGVQLLANTAIMTAFCLVKEVALPIIRKFWTKWRPLYELTSGNFYFEKGANSVLKRKFAHMRNYFTAAYYAAIAIGVCDCLFALIFSGSDVFRFPFYPVFGIIVLGEISFFFNGFTVGEDIFKDDKEDEDEKKTISIDSKKLRDALKYKFGDRISLEDEIPGQTVETKIHDWEKEMMLEDDLDQVTGAYFTAMQKSGKTVTADYVSATRKLLHQESVLIYNPFYHDLTDYILLPMFHEMLNHNSCLVVCGRMTNEEDITNWLKDGITRVTNLPKLWKIEKLTAVPNSSVPDIGILSFQDLYDIDNLKANKAFYEKAKFIVLLEPSNLLGTGQIGIRSIIQHCEQSGKKLTFCILDRNADGLVDALSHVVRQSITEVIASPVPKNAYSRVFWKADGPGLQTRILPRISHYLGIGTEIAALAMNKGVEDIHWYSGNKMPLADLKWNSEQYYAPICKYIHSPAEQSEMSRRFHFHQNLWQADFDENAFVLAEDEFCNVFEMSRTFAARTKKNGFINILSENYMLRDYMCSNDELFTNDPKAIPSIVPDYARTHRNFILRTIMMMAASPVDEHTLNNELSLHGFETKNTYNKLTELIEEQLGIKDFHIQTLREYVGIGGSRFSRFSYQIDKSVVENVFDAALKSAFYVVENEKLETYPMGNRLMGHIEQVILPGQFFVYDGKYYQARSISAKNGIIVRRSADHLDGRCYYRQLRDYSLSVHSEDVNVRNIRSMMLQTLRANICVETDGYLELKSRNLLTESIHVSLDAVRKRNITHKEVLKVSIPDASPEIRFTLCVLINELLHTIYPNESGYITAVTGVLPESVLNRKEYRKQIRSLVPYLNVIDQDDKAIYFIEDSCIDLGLLVSIERNFQRLLEILFDYLDWYLHDQDKPESGDKPEEPESEDKPESPESEDNPEGSSGSDQEPKEDTDSEPEESAGAAEIAGSKAATEDVDGEDEELIDDETASRKWKADAPYLTFGGNAVPDWLALEETFIFLRDNQFGESNLHRSRKKTPEFDEGSTYDPNQPGTHYCDFCGRPLKKGEYDVLKDGRERCPECSKDAIKTRKQFKALYEETLGEMERIFGISIDVPVKVRMVNANKVNDIPGAKFVPTPHMDGRVLGYAQSSKDGYKLLCENGAPKWKCKSTIVHELSHIWQFTHWDYSKIDKLYPDKASRGIAVEGMAVWTEVQYLIAMGEKDRAIMYKRNREADPSEYGVGMIRYIKKYPIKEVASLEKKKTPFTEFPPI